MRSIKKILKDSVANSLRSIIDSALSARLINIESKLSHLEAIERKIDLLEHFSNGGRSTYVGNNRVLVKVIVSYRHLAFYVEADDKLLSPWLITAGMYETPLTEYFVRELSADSHCVDVGSNFGYFTGLMARFAPEGRVIGIEADERIYDLARDNVFINGIQDRAEVLHAAAGNSDQDMTLYRRVTRSGNTSIVDNGEQFTSWHGEPPAEPFVVKGVRIDDLLPRMDGRIDFIKLDVEGAEPLVFEGARAAIAANPGLSIVMEWSPGQIQAAGFPIPAFLDLLRDLGLSAYDIVPGGIAPITYADLLDAPYKAGVVLKRS